MDSKDKIGGLSKEGCGRVAAHRWTGIPLSFTLECNYNLFKLKSISLDTQ